MQTSSGAWDQVKVNLLVRRLPKLRDPKVSPEEAFAGTVHVNEAYDQLATAYQAATAGQLPGRGGICGDGLLGWGAVCMPPAAGMS